MRFWIRELAGWALIAIGLLVFYRCVQLLTDGNHYILEGGSLTLMGVVIFRGGIHLLKVAMAARACVESSEQLRGGSAPPVAVKRPVGR